MKSFPAAGERSFVSRRRRTVLVLFVFCMVIYNSNCRLIGAGDTIPARLLPFAILNHGTLYADRYVSHATGWFQATDDGHLVSVYPVVLPVLVAPLYVPAAAYIALAHPPAWRFETLCEVWEKGTASLIASLSVVVLFVVLRALTSQRNAVLLAVAYAIGTETWSISSQALWQHGLAELLMAVGLWLTIQETARWRDFAMGALCGLMAFNRPPDVLFSAALAAGYLRNRRGSASRLVAGAVAAGLPFLVYNLMTFGSAAGGYGHLVRMVFEREDPLPVALAALLVSPGKGLFVYSPFLLFALASWFLPAGARIGRTLNFLWSAWAGQLLVYGLADWTGGFCYGPRFLTDGLPILIVALVPVVERLSPSFGKPVFLLCVAISIGMQGIGAFCFPGGGSVFVSRDEFWKLGGAQFYREAMGGPVKPIYFAKVMRWVGLASPVDPGAAARRVRPGTNLSGATFVRQTYPATVEAGSVFTATVTFQNTGRTTWTRGDDYKLGSLVPGDPWGSRVALSVIDAIAPGQQKTFRIAATAPNIGGAHRFQWRMVQEMVEWFGPVTPSVFIDVKPQPTREVRIRPCRLLDTRRADPSFGGPALAPSALRTFRVAGLCGTSLDAKAVVYIVTVVRPADNGLLTIFPAGVAPPETSAISYRRGQTRANNGIVGLGRFGELSFVANQATGTTHILLDLVGYFR